MGIAEAVFLITFVLTNTGGNFQIYYTGMPDMPTCLECLKTARINIPSAGDAEAVVVMYCAENSMERDTVVRAFQRRK